MTDIITLDKNGILEYQKNRPPFLMIDAATEIIPGVSAKGYKQLDPSEWFFACHFEGDPLMPGMLQVEAIVQMSALMVTTQPGNKGKICYLTNADKLQLKRRVIPNDRFDIDTRMLSFKRGVGKIEGTGTVNGELACKVEFMIVVPSILEGMRPGQPII